MTYDKNELEKQLELAARDIAERTKFYEILLDSEVFVVSDDNQPQNRGVSNLTTGDTVSLFTLNSETNQPYVPFFSSLTALQKSITDEVSFIRFKVRDLFELTSGSHLILNPGHDFSKEFTSEEIQRILTGNMAGKRILEKKTKVLIGQPEEYPEELIAKLSEYFFGVSVVERAFLAQMMTAEEETSGASYVVGVMLPQLYADDVFEGAGVVISSLKNLKMPVDLVLVGSSLGGLSNYFLKETPFYHRKKKGFLSKIFG